MNNKTEELLADYLDNRLSATQRQELEDYFAKNKNERQVFDELKNTFLAIQKPVEQAFDSLHDTDFYAFLAKEKKKKKPLVALFNQPIFRYAAGLAGLLFTFWFGRQSVDNQVIMNNNTQNIEPKIRYVEKIIEVPIIKTETKHITQKQLKQAMPEVMNEIGSLKKEMQATKDLMILTMLKRESASERIQAVNYSYELQKPDENVLNALIYTLDFDQNINVRSAAVDAIARFGNIPEVRNALIKSLLKQQEPTLQISIIELLTTLNERRALPALRLLVEDDGVSEFVRQKAEESSKFLSLNL